ncbi:hypothetical protein GCM10011403_29810 [Pseudohongiella nitratireducens]|uniref:Uncharacterized protein n=1 Tax=Pseudohongiella nitratireducens TaxID=1768907 RepID=A0A916QPU7_9GAMM|nr:hypothetical protein GCM10011403_29810 [Pseudohongiella nitratireducens]
MGRDPNNWEITAPPGHQPAIYSSVAQQPGGQCPCRCDIVDRLMYNAQRLVLKGESMCKTMASVD